MLKWHSTRNDVDAKLWEKAIKCGGQFRVRPKKTKVCSNHFAAGYYTPDCNVPTLFMKGYNNKEKKNLKTPKATHPPKTFKIYPNSKCDSDSDFDMEYKDSSEPIEVIITKPIPSHQYAISTNELHMRETMKLCFFRGEIKNLEEENRNLKEQLKCRKPLSYNDIKDDDKNVKMMTGLQGNAMFEYATRYLT